MPQSVTILSNRQKNAPDAFKLVVDGHELNDIVSYELKESMACPKYSEHFSKKGNPVFQTIFRHNEKI